MTIITHEAALLSASRREMIQWASENRGFQSSRQLLKGAFLPRRLPKLSSTLSRTSTFAYKSFKTPFGANSNHTLTKSTQPPAQTLSSLQLLFDKPSKTRDDINDIHTAIKENHRVTAEERTQALKILLKYRRYDELVDLLSSSTDLQGQTFYLVALVSLGDLTKVTGIMSSLTGTQKEKLLNYFYENLNTRGKTSLLFWIATSRSQYPDLKVAHKPRSQAYMQPLLSILTTFPNASTVVKLSLEHITIQEERQNWLNTLSYAYYMKSDPKSITVVWEQAPPSLKSSTLLGNAIQAYSALKEYETAIQIFLDNQSLATKKMKKDLVLAVRELKIKGVAARVLMMQLEDNVVIDWKMATILKQLLATRRLRLFQKAAAAYTSQNKPKVGVTNVLLSHELRSSDSDKFYKLLRDLYNNDSKPTSRTFKLLFDQFAKHGQITEAMSLLEVLFQRGEELTVDHFTSILQTCERSQAIYQLPKIISIMRKKNISPDLNFRTALMSLHYSLKKFQEVQRLFAIGNEENEKHFPALLILMRSLLMEKKYDQAGSVFKALLKVGSRSTADLFQARLEYHCMQGHFKEALHVVGVMQKKRVKMESRHYQCLMKAYNDFGLYDRTIVVFKLAMSESSHVTSGVYRESIVALVKLGIINEKNFADPTAAVRQLLESYKDKTLPLIGDLKFKTIKPLVRALINTYDVHEAFRIMSEYTKVRSDFDITDNIGFMKQEMLLFAVQKKWKSFEDVYLTFQERVKQSLVDDSEASFRMKKIYNSVITQVYMYHRVKKDVPGFIRLFEDLIFVHKFTFDSNRINWIARRLIRHPSSIHDGLKLIEKRLIGGLISKRVTRSQNMEKRRLGLKDSGPVTSKESTTYLKLSYLVRCELNEVLYNHILVSARKKKKAPTEVYEYYAENYPKTMSTLVGIKRRLRRREYVLKLKREGAKKASALSKDETAEESL